MAGEAGSFSSVGSGARVGLRVKTDSIQEENGRASEIQKGRRRMPENAEKKIGEVTIKCQPSTTPATWLPDRVRGRDSRNNFWKVTQWRDRHFYPQNKLILLRSLETGCGETTSSVE